MCHTRECKNKNDLKMPFSKYARDQNVVIQNTNDKNILQRTDTELKVSIARLFRCNLEHMLAEEVPHSIPVLKM